VYVKETVEVAAEKAVFVQLELHVADYPYVIDIWKSFRNAFLF
jgi:hypothetical protein